MVIFGRIPSQGYHYPEIVVISKNPKLNLVINIKTITTDFTS